MRILRHNKTDIIISDLDPIEDLLNYIFMLKSTGFTSDLLREVHGFTHAAEIKKTAKLISLHISNAVGLAQQGLKGPAETSFLPLYYSTLNLSKVYLLLLGKRTNLERNRWHGAKYEGSEMNKNFLNEKIQISNNGTIPLIYESISGLSIGGTGFNVSLSELYGNITSISSEYETITKDNPGFMGHSAEIIRDDANGHFLKVQILDKRFFSHPPQPRTLKAYPGLRIITKPSGKKHYETRKQLGTYTTIERNILRNIKRHLISDEGSTSPLGVSWISYTPINGRAHVFNEELSIMLAYFHLSNVVRYNPEHLYKLMDSKYWSIMLCLRKHGFLKFEKLMWGNFIQKSFDIG